MGLFSIVRYLKLVVMFLYVFNCIVWILKYSVGMNIVRNRVKGILDSEWIRVVGWGFKLL